jgi:low affinity Fe/Cu permease
MTTSRIFASAANYVAEQSGRPYVFVIALASVIGWMVTGPYFGYSDTWQLVMNSWTNVLTFLMVFLIQNTQNRDSAALQIKINELIRSGQARNTFVGIEHLTTEELNALRRQIEARTKSEHKDAPAKGGRRA